MTHDKWCAFDKHTTWATHVRVNQWENVTCEVWCSHFCQPPPRPRVFVWRFFTQHCDLCETSPWLRQFQATINVPRIVLLTTSTYSSGIENDPSFGTWSLTFGSTWRRKIQVQTVVQISSVSVSYDWDPSDSLWRTSLCSSPPAGWSWTEVVHRKTWSLPDNWPRKWSFHHFSAREPPSRWVSEHGFPTRRHSPARQCLRPWCLFFQKPPRIQHTSHEGYWQNFLAKLVESWLVLGRNRMLLNHRSERNYGPMKWSSESPFIRCFPAREEVLDISKMTSTFHGIQRTTVHPSRIATAL